LILQWTASFRRALTVVGATTAAVVAFAAPAQAHTAILLDATDVLPWQAPLILDGTDPIATFGVLPDAGAVRSFQLRMQAGQQVLIEYQIPDLAPENGLPTAHLPVVVLVAPDGSVTALTPQMREPIEDSGQGYLRLRTYAAPAVRGTYSLLVTGLAPARFLLLTGIESEEFHGIARGSEATHEQLAEWLENPP
jgi:hypothetical protein